MQKLLHYFFVIWFVLFGFVNIHAEEDGFDDAEIEQIENNDIREDFDAEELDVKADTSDKKVKDQDQEQEEKKSTEASSAEEPAQTTIVNDQAQEVVVSPNVKRVTGIEFFQNQASSQIVIKLNEPADYKTYSEENGKIVVIHVKNTILPSKWRRFLDTSEFRSAVSFIKPYPIAGSQNSFKLIVKLRDQVAVNVRRNGSDIVFESEIPEKYFAAKPDDVKPSESKDEKDTGVEAADEEIGLTSEEQKISKDEELAEQLGKEGELGDKDSIDKDEIVSEEEEYVEENDYAADEFLATSATEIEGFTITELAEDHKFTGKKVTVNFKEADIAHVLDFISEICNMNILLGDAVKGKITLKLKDVPWDQALAIILQSKMLGAVRSGKVIRIESLEKLKKEQEESLEAIKSAQKIEPLKTFMIPINYASASSMKTQLSDFTTPDRGKITVDERTNTLIVQDLASNIERMKNLIYKLDTQTPQVLIEARIIEVANTFSRGLNLDWGALGGKITNSPLTYASNITAGGSFKGETFGTFSLGFLNLAKLGDVTLALKLGEKRDEVKLLSAPRVITQDNKPATITQSDQITVTTKTVTTSSAGTVSQESPTQLSATLSLNVTPKITSDGGILLSINISNAFFKDQEGAMASRAAQTTVMVENGDTTVIGGIYSSHTAKSRAGIPFLSWIPLIGWIFSSNSTTTLRNELMIFITPTITNTEKAFAVSGNVAEKENNTFDPENETESTASDEIDEEEPKSDELEGEGEELEEPEEAVEAESSIEETPEETPEDQGDDLAQEEAQEEENDSNEEDDEDGEDENEDEGEDEESEDEGEAEENDDEWGDEGLE